VDTKSGLNAPGMARSRCFGGSFDSGGRESRGQRKSAQEVGVFLSSQSNRHPALYLDRQKSKSCTMLAERRSFLRASTLHDRA